MNMLYFAFSNSASNPLDSLTVEERNIDNALTPGKRAGEFDFITDSFANLSVISQRLRDYQDRITWFHFSGHANRDHLLLGDQLAHSGGILQMLSACPKLKGVVLNGCATGEQAIALKNAGIPFIIGTSAPVGDRRAMRFSKGFYDLLTQYKTVKEAFDMSIGEPLSMAPFEVHRDLDETTEASTEAVWGMFVKDTDQYHLKLPFGEKSLEKIKSHLKELVMEDISKALKELNELINANSNYYNQCIMLIGRHNRNTKNERMGITSESSNNLEKNRILHSLLGLIDGLEESDLA